MPRTHLASLLLVIAATRVASSQAPVPAQPPVPEQSQLVRSVDAQLPVLIGTYKDFHRSPELSHHEEHTSAKLAAGLRDLGYKVTEHVGVYQDGSKAWGVVATLENGPGP